MFIFSFKETINNINLTRLYQDAIRRNVNETMTGQLYVIGDLSVLGNVIVTGLTNGIDLSEYQLQSPVMEDSLDETERALLATIENQCSSLAFITNALAGKCTFKINIYFSKIHQIVFKSVISRILALQRTI